MKLVVALLLVLVVLSVPMAPVAAEHGVPLDPFTNLPIKVRIASQTYLSYTDSLGMWSNFEGLPTSASITVDEGPITSLVPGATVTIAGSVFRNHTFGSLPFKTVELWDDVNRNDVYGDPTDRLVERVYTDAIGDFEFSPYTVPPQQRSLGVKILVGSQPLAHSINGQLWLEP